MTTQTTYTTQEQDLIKSLISLGDSKELAEKTVLNERNKPNNSEFYRLAYEG